MSTTPTAPSGHSHYTWEAPGAPVTIHLNFDVIDRITPEVMRGFMALRRRGAEVGGILFGHAGSGVVTVEEFTAVPCEYAAGPSYHLSANDRGRLEEALVEARGRGLQAVGLFRSHTRPDLTPDDHDVALCEAYLGKPDAVMLLIRPAPTRPATAGFFLWHGARLERGPARLEFPFSRRDLGGGESKIVAPQASSDRPAPRPLPQPAPANQKFTFGPPPEPSPAPQAAMTPRLEPVVPVPAFLAGVPASEEKPPLDPAEREKRRVWYRVPALIALCVLAGVVALRWSKTGLPWEDPSLGMAVTESGQQIDVTWNRTARALRDARTGTLTIRDGVVERTIDMSPEQLRDGKVRYSRVTGDVMMRLEVESVSGEKMSESVRVLSGEAPPQPAAVIKKDAPLVQAAPAVDAPRVAPPKPEPPKPSPADQPKTEAANSVEAAKPIETAASGDEPPLRRTKRGRKTTVKKTEAAEPKPETEPPDPTLSLRPGRRK